MFKLWGWKNEVENPIGYSRRKGCWMNNKKERGENPFFFFYIIVNFDPLIFYFLKKHSNHFFLNWASRWYHKFFWHHDIPVKQLKTKYQTNPHWTLSHRTSRRPIKNYYSIEKKNRYLASCSFRKKYFVQEIAT